MSLGGVMMRDITRIEGLDSIWRFDAVTSRYQRTPRWERPRERPEWGDERTGACQDWVWHDLDSWWMTEDRQRLVVVPVAFLPFWAPLTAAASDEAFDVWERWPVRKMAPTNGSPGGCCRGRLADLRCERLLSNARFNLHACQPAAELNRGPVRQIGETRGG